ncbi:MAG: CPBP family intramembrane metalloprotease [Euryarchaeota archaeon]|nr:CPBP family intramembrane metalloprotease [Euryarchaeota archaeon]
MPFIGACLLLGGGAYLALDYGLPLTPFGRGAHQLAVFIGFLAVPFTILLFTRRSPELGGLDRGFLAGIGTYLLFLLPLLALVPMNPEHFRWYRTAAPGLSGWAFFTLIQVASVDFFTKRIVQLEVERAGGPAWGILAQFLAWAGAHVLEYGWLKDLAGPAGAVLFLGLTGAVTGLVYWRTKNVLGMMAGHWILNLLLVAAALAYYP